MPFGPKATGGPRRYPRPAECRLPTQRHRCRSRSDYGAGEAGAVTDRDADCWEPLIAAADVAAGPWPDTARCCAVAFVKVLRGDGEERLSIRLLSDIRSVLGDDDQAATVLSRT